MLTYQDRLNEMRKTKIRHTREKREQDGFRDLDDFGTVPLPEGYFVEPIYNSENGAFYGLDGMSENFVRVFDAHPAYVDPMEMLCGRWRDMLVNYRGDIHYLPKWLKENERFCNIVRQGTHALWSKRWDEKRFPYDHLKPLQEKYNLTSGIDADAHFACDYSIGFELGFGGLLDKVRYYREKNPEKRDFYDAEEKVLLSIIRFIDRHIEEIDRQIATEERPELKASLIEMKKTCEAVRLGKPESFREVCQFVAFFNCAARVYTRDGAGFQLDTMLNPYYERDVKAGVLDDETAKFLIANLLLIDPHYYQISGVDENDRDVTCHLSYLILEAADSINISTNLTVRVHDNCDPEFLRTAVGYLFKNKNGWPRFCSDKNLSEGYMRLGVDKKTARERIAVGCNWMAVPGKEFPMNDTVKINIAKVFSVALEEMRTMENKSSELLYSLFEKHLEIAAETIARGVEHHLDYIHAVTPELIMNLMFRGSIEQGLDASQCAELYTVGCDGAGLAVVADSFGAIRLRLEEEGRIDWDQLYSALDSDFEDERVRLMLNSSPKYCGGNTISDAYAKRLTDTWVRVIRGQKMSGGRTLVPGWFSWARTIEYGGTVPATPNGRRRGEPISHGANPNPHFRVDGAVTAQSSGIAAVQCGYGNTAPLQLEFDPKITVEEGGVDVVASLIRAHFDEGGTLININVLDQDKILAANQNPDLYPDLVVRVTGFTAYFANLSPGFRKLVVDRFLTM